MELTHEFTVPATKEETWAAFDDIGSVAQCFPGATVTEATGESFSGQVKVKLGPVALLYKGSGDFTEKDEAAGVMRISAKGKDKRGNGTAGADVVARFAEAGDGSTTVTVQTDLAITGKPAQFGRGVIEDISNKLLAQFVDCLSSKVGQPEPEVGAAPEPGPEPESEPQAAASGPAPAEPAAAGDARAGADTQDELAARRAPAGDHRASGGDSLDLGATVLPVLVKSYGPQVAGGLVALVLLRWLVRRRR